jgi:hypothetical protein
MRESLSPQYAPQGPTVTGENVKFARIGTIAILGEMGCLGRLRVLQVNSQIDRDR